MRNVWIFPTLALLLLVASCGRRVSTQEPAVETSSTPQPTETQVQLSQTPVAAEETSAQPEAAAAPLPAVYAEDAVAIRGADPVAYFTEGTYVQGSDQFSYDWSGATWYFASAEHRDLFASAPEQYAPQYGGFCAWAVSQGYTAPIEPEAWKVVDGKLYLNYDKRIQARWERDIAGHIAQADANWPAVVTQ